ncbi:hypothetical protein ACFW6V_34220 [Streptomyces sp. NPDC058734]|uniref:hypothetical protein n=1 Tax=Streptomyces sp. NPDC058734 TaxID=3346615 RepID=UPI003694695C
MTRLRRSGLLLPYVLLLLALLAVLTVQAPGARAAAADPCRKDRLGGAKVTASADFDHRGTTVHYEAVAWVPTRWKTLREGGPAGATPRPPEGLRAARAQDSYNGPLGQIGDDAIRDHSGSRRPGRVRPAAAQLARRSP